jgi:hypothetical protein
MKAGRCFVQAVAVLAVFAVARSFGLLGPAVLSVSLLTAALVLIAWSAGATRAGQRQWQDHRPGRGARPRRGHVGHVFPFPPASDPRRRTSGRTVIQAARLAPPRRHPREGDCPPRERMGRRPGQ